MNYKIGEVSKMFNISKEMLRYYEKKGVLHPKRIDEIIIVFMMRWISSCFLKLFNIKL